MSDHVIVFVFDDGSVTTRLECRAAAGADCRLVGGDDCQCEEWAVERDAEGNPYHESDYTRHYMVDSGHCNAELFVNDAPEDSGTGRFTAATIPVNLTWEGDWYSWQRADTDRTTALARTLFNDETGMDWDTHERDCNHTEDCTLKAMYLADARRYAAILNGEPR